MGQDGTEGRSPPRPRAPDTVGPETRQPTSLRGRADQATAATQPRGRDRYRGLNGELLRECWGDLNQDAARGVAGVTWPALAEPLPTTVAALVERRQQKRYRAPRMRRHYLPQGHGQERP
jgi:hypothetical protein